MSVGNWVVAQTKPQQERWAAENVARQGFDWYLPLTPTAKPGRPSRIGCLFPRYLFVWIEGRWHSLRGTFGIVNLIMNGPTPAVLPEKAVESLRSREDAQGVIRLPNTLSGPLFRNGDLVRVNGGPFSGFQGLVEGQSGEDRNKILLDFMGRKISVLIQDEHLEPAHG